MGSELTDRGVQELNILIQDIVERAQGVFLWVRLVVDELIDGLCEGDSIEELRDLLSTIPFELEELYTRTIRRARSTSLRKTAKNRIESYMMFHTVLRTRKPFGLYELLAATLFLTTQKGNYHDLPERLPLDQMERRLNSQSAGLLETVGWRRGDSYKKDVEFIHQTVKEFMLIDTGSMVICEGLLDPPKDSGFLLIYRYLLSLLKYFNPGDEDIDAQNYVSNEFTFYAQKVDSETGRCAGHYLELSLSGFTEQSLCDILICIINPDDQQKPGEHFLHFYTCRHTKIILSFMSCNLYRSLSEYILSHITELTAEDSFQIFKEGLELGLGSRLNPSLALTSMVWHPSCRCLEVLLETGLGTKLSLDAFTSLNQYIHSCISSDSNCSNLLRSTSDRTHQLWKKLQEEKTSSRQHP